MTRDDVAAFARAFVARAEASCEGKWWPPRAALLAYLAYAGVRHLADDLYRSWFSGLTLVLHEGGHLLFSAFGRTLYVAGGSIVQIAAPIAAGAHLLFWQGDFFGAAVGGAWLSFATFELATYVADANKERLPLVGFSDHPEHDWSLLLTDWHLLNACDAIGAALRLVAAATWLASMGAAAWLVVTMARDAAARRLP